MSRPDEGPAQPSLRRMRRFGLRPDHDLGQNFLIDSNMLGVIGRAAELSHGDVVLEIGGGLGVLSEHLAAHAAHVHVVEVDERLREALLEAVGRERNVTLHWGDAMQIELAALSPAPGKVVANLPYGIAAAVLLRTVTELEAVTLWVAMVQKEVGERLAAEPGTAAYGLPSVLAQLSCEVKVLRPVARSVFHPAPNVDSVLIRMRRRAGAVADAPQLRALVAASFAHRRKTLAGSLALARGSEAYRPRERVRAALEAIGQRADARAERLSPEQFRALAEELSR